MDWMDSKTNYLPPPKECNIDPYAECQLDCRFCIVQRYVKNHRDEVGPMRKLPTEYLLRLVYFLKEFGVKAACFSGGGEPTLHDGLSDALYRCAHIGLESSLVTNMADIKFDVMESLMQARWVAMSVDACDQETYKLVKGRDRFFDVITNIQILTNLKSHNNSKVDLAYKMLILEENYTTIFETCKLAKELGCNTFHCFPKGTPVLMGDGSYKDIECVKVNDKILNGKIADVDNILTRYYKGDIFKVKAKFIPEFSCTGEHPIYISYLKYISGKKYISFPMFKNAKDIIVYNSQNRCGDALVIPKKLLCSRDTFVDFSNYTKGMKRCYKDADKQFLEPIKVNDELAELFGWYVAEGSRGGYKRSCIAFSLNKSEKSYIERICYLVEKYFNRKPYIQIGNDNCASIKFGSKVLFKALPEMFGHNSHNKKIPDFIMFARDSVVNSFLDAYFKGDGTSTSNIRGDVNVCSVSKQLIYQLQLLYMKVGKIVGMSSIDKTKGGFGGGKSYRLNWNIKRSTNQYIEDEDNYYLPIVKFKKEEFEGLVYNLSTSNDIYAMPFIVHNCRPVDLERSDINGHKKQVFNMELIYEQFARCHEIEDDNFSCYTIVHKFDKDFHVVQNFDRCLSSPLLMTVLTDGNSYVCVDKKMEKSYLLGSAFPEPLNILNWWGSEAHRERLKQIDVKRDCGNQRCTFCKYNEQIEQSVISDNFFLNFP